MTDHGNLPVEQPDHEPNGGPSAGPPPWDCDPPPDEETGPDGRRLRHDAFTARRKHEFLSLLMKSGCLLDACRTLKVAPSTVYRHQQEDPLFAGHCRAALAMAAVPVEITAWQRAVEGVEHAFACGGEVHVRRRYSDLLLRLLLQGSNPKKFGPNPGFKRKRLLRHERKQMEREIRAEIRARGVATDEEVVEALTKRLAAFGRRVRAEAESQGEGDPGWTRSPEGWSIPPGYAPIPGWAPPPEAIEEDATPRDIV